MDVIIDYLYFNLGGSSLNPVVVITAQNYYAEQNNYFRPADSVKAGGYFFYLWKTHIGAFLVIFHGDLDFFDLHEKSLERPQ